MITETFTRQGSQHNLVQTPLGKWTKTPQQFWGTTEDKQFLYHHTKKETKRFKKVANKRSSRRQKYQCEFLSEVDLPSKIRVVDVGNNTWNPLQTITNIGPILEIDSDDDDADGLDITIQNDPWLWEDIVWVLPKETLRNTNGTIWFISDGSYRDGVGTSAIVFASIAIAKTLIDSGDIGNTIIFGLDGLQALNSVVSKYTTIDQSDRDMVMFIRTLHRQIPLSVRWMWIRGHQDSVMSYHELEWEARINIAADKLANQRSRQLAKSNFTPQVYKFSTDKISLSWRNIKTSDFRLPDLYDMVTQNETEQYWQNIKGWDEQVMGTIAWDTFGAAFCKAKGNIKRRIVRLASDHAPTGDNMVRWKKREHSNCPACDALKENMQHILICPKMKHT